MNDTWTLRPLPKSARPWADRDAAMPAPQWAPVIDTDAAPLAQLPRPTPDEPSVVTGQAPPTWYDRRT
ncbi:hypothetical protein [Amycolatopsis sp. DSM 110486]|uniref:hypothetical protein n=1 Tax=Amycolatopsis sp. DSM 110486 TaxID=2865832 RepID=UPI001C6A0CE7|nr:hypothetical protein [Amycolatopsis sp. DSM 110486]QYN19156.1 hypothetical protein K1T34_41950 [Amycolatopsis sp. DSM 110486]